MSLGSPGEEGRVLGGSTKAVRRGSQAGTSGSPTREHGRGLKRKSGQSCAELEVWSGP